MNKPKYGIADKRTDEGFSTGWLCWVTADFPKGLFRGKKHAKTFESIEEAAKFVFVHDLEEVFILPL